PFFRGGAGRCSPTSSTDVAAVDRALREQLRSGLGGRGARLLEVVPGELARKLEIAVAEREHRRERHIGLRPATVGKRQSARKDAIVLVHWHGTSAFTVNRRAPWHRDTCRRG